MKTKDQRLLEEAYRSMFEDTDIDVDSLKHSMGNQDMKQTDYDAPYAVICHGQSYEWYGNDDPSTGEGRYKPKGDCGTVLAINIPTKEQAEEVRSEMQAKLDERDPGEWDVDYSLCQTDDAFVVRMSELGEHFYQYDDDSGYRQNLSRAVYNDEGTSRNSSHDRELFKDYGAKSAGLTL